MTKKKTAKKKLKNDDEKEGTEGQGRFLLMFKEVRNEETLRAQKKLFVLVFSFRNCFFFLFFSPSLCSFFFFFLLLVPFFFLLSFSFFFSFSPPLHFFFLPVLLFAGERVRKERGCQSMNECTKSEFLFSFPSSLTTGVGFLLSSSKMLFSSLLFSSGPSFLFQLPSHIIFPSLSFLLCKNRL